MVWYKIYDKSFGAEVLLSTIHSIEQSHFAKKFGPEGLHVFIFIERNMRSRKKQDDFIFLLKVSFFLYRMDLARTRPPSVGFDGKG